MSTEEVSKIHHEIKDQSLTDYPPETAELMSWSAIRFIRAPSSSFLLWSIVFIALAIICVGILSSFISFDVSIKAPGQITSGTTSRKAMSQSAGKLSVLFVERDNRVKKNEVIGLIDIGTNMEQKIWDALQAFETMETKLRKGDYDKVSSLLKQDLPTSKDFESGSALSAMIDLENQINSFSNVQLRQKKALGEEIRPLRKKISLLQSKLKKIKASSQKDFLGQFLEETQGDLDATRAQIRTAENESKLRIEQNAGDVLKSLLNAKGELSTYLKDRQIIAPIDGQVFELYKKQNEYLEPGDQIALIQPGESKLMTTATRVFAKDMVKINVGQKILYRMDAYPVQTYGFFQGEVVSFEQSQKEEADLREYIIYGSIDFPADLSENLKDNMKFVVGMNFNADIVTGRESGTKMLQKMVFGEK